MSKKFVCLSGLPRTGSTLLSAILCQNPEIHAEGNSAVCQLMWDLQESCNKTASQQLAASNRSHTIYDLISEIPKIYYKDIKESIIIDKCRSWTIPANIDMLKKYIDKDFKIIVLERPIIEIIKSFANLYQDNNAKFNPEQILLPGSEPIMRSITGINWAKKNNDNNNFLFISYNDLISDTKNTIQKIYEFCGWKYFDHDFENVVIKYPENDDVYQLKGQHEIRKKVEKREVNIVLPENISKQCLLIDKLMGYK
jgi:sulfotransferase